MTQAAAKVAADQSQVSSATTRARERPERARGRTSRPATVYGQSSTYTALPAVGKIVNRGQRLYAISGQPVVLLYGPVAAVAGVPARHVSGARRRRAEREPRGARLRRTASVGDCVHERDLGGDRRASRPRTASRRTGQLLLGSVVFEPGPVRVTAVTPTLGATVQPGPVLSDHLDQAAGHDRARRRAAVRAQGRRPGRDHAARQPTTPGRVSYVGTVATTRELRPGRRRGGSSTPTIEVDVTPTRPGRDRASRPGAGERLDHDRERQESARGPGERAARARKRRLRRRGGRRRRRPPTRSRSSSACSTTPTGSSR